jgi:uncharacterized protein
MTSMAELPLFPLNTVLFPGMPLNLHIFEERYKQMVQWCLEMEQPFGVTLIRKGQEALGPLAEPHEVGCTARIMEVEHLPEGRMNLMALGETRFRLRSLKYDRPYLVGEIDPFPLEDASTQSLSQPVRELLPWVKRYMQILASVSDINLDTRQLPEDPLVLTYLAAVLLQLPPAQKQTLLASERAVDLVSDMRALYRREVALLEAMFSEGSRDAGQTFSSN